MTTRRTHEAHAREQRCALIKALVALLVLTVVSWGLAYVPLGNAGMPVALGIAAIKALIVAAVFMELAHVNFTYRFVAMLTFGFIALICAGVALDVLFR